MDSPRFVVTVPTAELAADVQPVPDSVEVLVWAMDAAAPRDRIDIVVPPYLSMGKIFPLLDGIEVGFVQGQSIGFEGIADLLPDGFVFANAASVHESSTAELAVALTLAAQRHLPAYVRAQDEHRWAPDFSESLADRRVLLLGYGGVGTAIAARLAPFDVEITAVARSARTQDGVVVHGIDELIGLLGETEILITSLPGGEETRHIIDDEVLSALPDGALVVNVGRGPLIDTDALVDHATRGRIRAALDVTDPEPLPEDHPLWRLRSVLISPHVGGASSAMHPRIAKLIRTQIERLAAGRPPINIVVDKRG